MTTQVKFDDMVQFLRKEGWHFGIGEHDTLSLAFEGDHGSYNAMILYPWEKEIIIMYVEYPFRIPEERRGEIMELVARVNWGLLFGVCEYHPEWAIVRFRATMLTDDAPFHATQFSTMIATVLSSTDRYAPAFDALLKDGLSVSEALALVEGRRS